jgi:phenylalanyl-tRNA synthetase beta chain
VKISFQWLSDYIDLTGVTPEELAELLTGHGIPVEVIEPLNKGVRGVVVGHVLSVEPHPDADRLRLCKVDAGGDRPLTIVCGASNVAPGQKVPTALPGSELPGKIIEKARLRGVTSEGMLCSARELGLDVKLLPREQTEGLYLLPPDAEAGASVADLLRLDDVVLELELTPNRSDCLSVRGVAYEVGAILDRPVHFPERVPPKDQATSPVSVSIASDACSYYGGQVIRGVRVVPSPLWMQMRLMAVGVRPINAIVDATNYVMLEWGQPLHAFDFSRVIGSKIIVRQARRGETLETLDGVVRELDESMLVIADAERPIALAGVMGGQNSEVRQETDTLLLESALFSSRSVRATSKKLGIRSEAALRFEKEMDPVATQSALDRVTALICELTGGEKVGGVVEDRKGEIRRPVTVSLRTSKVNGVLGIRVNEQEIAAILRRLRFAARQEGERFTVEVPTRRPDISREIDMIEEVARLFGYQRIPTTLPEGALTHGRLAPLQALRRKVRHVLVDLGFFETWTYSFIHPGVFRRMDPEGVLPGVHPLTGRDMETVIRLAHPMSEERSVLRTTLLPSLLDVAAYNRNRKNDDLAFFEIGTTFWPRVLPLEELPDERHVLAGVMTGKASTGSGDPVDFFLGKGVVEHLLERLGLPEAEYRSIPVKGLHPGQTALIQWKGTPIGLMGMVHPDAEESWDLRETFYFELDLGVLAPLADGKTVYRPLPRYPSVERDLAVVVDLAVPAGEIRKAILAAAGDLAESVRIFDVYQGEQVPPGKKSVAFSIVYRAPDRTLTDEEVNVRHESVFSALQTRFQAQRRG